MVYCIDNERLTLREGTNMITQDYAGMTDRELVDTYNAVMANAWPGDDAAIMAEMQQRGIDVDSEYFY